MSRDDRSRMRFDDRMHGRACDQRLPESEFCRTTEFLSGCCPRAASAARRARDAKNGRIVPPTTGAR